MGTKPVARFTVEIDGTPRSLFSVIETPTGNLTLGIRTDVFHRERNESPESITVPRKILQQYYSIHPSLESKEHINALNLHKHFDGGKIETSHYTKAIKGGNSYALMFVKRCSKQALPSDIAKPNRGKIISIGSYDPRNFTLIYGLVLSSVGHALELVDPYISTTFHDFKRFRLTVISTFMTMPASNMSLTGHVSTENVPSDGYSADDAHSWFVHEVGILFEETMEALRLSPTERELLRRIGCVSSRGRSDHPSFLLYRALIKRERILPGYLMPWPLA